VVHLLNSWNVMPDFPFPKSRRLLKAAEFDRVFHRRRSQSDSLVVVYACENALPHARLGLVVSRKCGNAVVRNRWKRCLRDAFRLVQHELPAGLDLVVLPRRGAAAASPRLRESLLMLAGRLARQLQKSPPAPQAAEPLDEAAP
jgi:ribonuclease P protein component